MEGNRKMTGCLETFCGHCISRMLNVTNGVIQKFISLVAVERNIVKMGESNIVKMGSPQVEIRFSIIMSAIDFNLTP